MPDRADRIVHHFSFLLSEFGYFVEQKVYDPQTMGNAFVIFKSAHIGIEIVIDRDQALMTMGDQSQPVNNWFEFTDVLKYFAPTEEPYVFDIPTPTTSWDEVVEAQLARLAIMLRQYCEPLVKGDLSMSPAIQKIQDMRTAATKDALNKLSQAYHERHRKSSS